MAAGLEPPVSSQSLIVDVVCSAFVLPVLPAADRAGAFPALDESPASSEEVPRKFGMPHRSARTMLRILAAKGFLAQVGGKFHLLDIAKDHLLPDSPFYCAAGSKPAGSHRSRGSLRGPVRG